MTVFTSILDHKKSTAKEKHCSMSRVPKENTLFPMRRRPVPFNPRYEPLCRTPEHGESSHDEPAYFRTLGQDSSEDLGPVASISATTLATQNGEVFSPKRPTIRKYLGWTLEIASLLTAVFALVALVIVLKIVDNQPLANWTFPISVNTLVSILSITMRSPLAYAVGSCLGQGKWAWFKKRQGPLSGFVIFDDASRGPLGCFSLLWWLKSR